MGVIKDLPPRPRRHLLIAEKAGIGRATLYKYFADVAAILRAWHARRYRAILSISPRCIVGRAAPASDLPPSWMAFAFIIRESHRQRGHHDMEFMASLHRDERVSAARQRLSDGERSRGSRQAHRPGFCTHAEHGEPSSALIRSHAYNVTRKLPNSKLGSIRSRQAAPDATDLILQPTC